MASKVMSEEEKKSFDDLYQYVKKNILGYDDSQALSSKMVLKLKGLSTGKAMENLKIQDRACYTYDVILATFKANRLKIANAIQGKEFNSEFNKFVYICAIVENNINDIYKRMNNAKKSQDKVENINTDTMTHQGAEYQRKSNDKAKGKFEDMW